MAHFISYASYLIGSNGSTFLPVTHNILFFLKKTFFALLDLTKFHFTCTSIWYCCNLEFLNAGKNGTFWPLLILVCTNDRLSNGNKDVSDSLHSRWPCTTMIFISGKNGGNYVENNCFVIDNLLYPAMSVSFLYRL